MTIRTKYTLIYGAFGLLVAFFIGNIAGGFTALVLDFILENRSDPYNVVDIFGIIPIAVTLVTIVVLTLAAGLTGWQVGRRKALKRSESKPNGNRKKT